MFRNRKFAVVVSLLLGLVAAMLVWNNNQRLQSQLQQEQAIQPAPVETPVPVVVAVRDIPAHTLLTPDLVKVAQVPPGLKLPDALTKVEDVAGKTTQYPIANGEQILPMKFATPKVSYGLADIVPAGKLAVSIEINELVAAGGLLVPGDHVDVLVTLNHQTAGKDLTEIILQNIDVLAVAQSYVNEQSSQTLAPAAINNVVSAIPGTSAGASPPPAQPPTPVADSALIHPDAKTVTLAVTPEQAERLILAEQQGRLSLALRPTGDTTTVEIPEATLSTIRSPLQQQVAEITGVTMSPTNARAGDTLTITITVKNTSNEVIHTQGPNPKFTYIQGQTFFSQNFPSQNGALRVGVSFDGHPSIDFPYRWGLGGDLAPGASTTVVGYVKLTYDMKPTNFWAGLIEEPATVLQDNEGTTLITVLPDNVAVVSVDAANVRSGPDLAASVVGQLGYGTEVPILGQEKDWFKIKMPDGRTGYVAAGWIIAPK
jgi:pilus assembly protein CpaB